MPPRQKTIPFEIEEPDVRPKDWTTSERVRLISSIGVSGTAHPERDIDFTLGFGTRTSFRTSRYITLGLHNHLLLRNWGQVSRFYGHIIDCEEIDTRCDTRADFWPLGWALVFSTAQAGWDITFGAEGPGQPWLSLGTAIIFYNNGRGWGSDEDVEPVAGHAGTIGAGYDFDVVGIGFRASMARGETFFASSGPPIFNALLSIDVLLPRDHGDRNPKKRDER